MAQLTDEEIRDVMPHLQRFALWLTRTLRAERQLRRAERARHRLG